MKEARWVMDLERNVSLKDAFALEMQLTRPLFNELISNTPEVSGLIIKKN